MALNSSDTFKNLTHFIGVVEDRNDPLNIGRVRVRCFGIHTEDKTKIPTKALPWAQPIMPFNSASISGVGVSPTGPVEGTFVFGLFLDGQEMQQPIILGTMVGIPEDKIASSVGFSDPLGIYPKEKYLKQSDVNRLARGESAWSEESLAIKVRDRTTEVPTAVPPTAKSVRDLDGPTTPFSSEDNFGKPGDFYYRNKWSEPNPRVGGSTGGGSPDTCYLDDEGKEQPWQGKKTGEKPKKSIYPFNHTYTTESGHVMEYDDTPGGERIHQYHTKGTFYEIQPDGTKVTKVIGDNYEILMKGNHVVVQGNMNLTVKGDVRLFCESNMYQEVKGDYHLRVDGDMVTKIRGNEQKVILTDKSTQINGNERKRITKNYQKTIEGTNEEKIIGTSNTTISSNVLTNIDGWKRELIGGSFTFVTGGNTNIVVGSTTDAAKGTPGNTTVNRYAANTGRFTIKTTSNVNIETAANFNLDANNDVTVDTPSKVLVGSNTLPANTVVKSTRIDLNP